MKKTFFTLVLLPALLSAQAKKPKLVVGIVVDQMRNDYIYRYWDRFTEGGFKKLISEGFYFKNAHYNYIPTYTGPGHASIYTGTTPRAHGIIGNDWFIKQNNGWTYCVQDDQVTPTGTTNKSGQASPKNLLSTTMTDELELNSNQKAKVFSFALKDRSAILPAGHAADGAFWFDDLTGNFISSSWYRAQLPEWLNAFNNRQMAKAYLEKGWNTLYPIGTYTNSLPDENNYESSAIKEQAIFPYSFSSHLEKKQMGIIKASPYGNSITKDVALACLKNEGLGLDEQTDQLCLSFSSTDIVAHATGPRAVEVEDIYLRLDKDIAEILTALDAQVGKGNYLVFLTADHGGAEVPQHLIDQKMPAGYFSEKKLVADLKQYFKNNYGDTILLKNISNEQIFLNETKMAELKLDRNIVESELCKYLVNVQGISEAVPSNVLKFESFSDDDYRRLLQNGYNHKMSGNVAFIYQSGWMDHPQKGTTHGAGYNYDTHVPVIFYGQGVKKGETYDYCRITQIAPTVCELMRVSQPSACTSVPLNNYFK